MQRYYDSVVAGGRRPHRSLRPDLPAFDQSTLSSLRVDQLRAAIRANLVTFPNQVPVFERHDRPDLQCKIVQLYFTLGWGYETIAIRFGLVHQRVAQILKTWKRRAIETGYVQYIPPFEPLTMPGVSAMVPPPQVPAFVVISSQVPPPAPLRVSSEISTY
ncbi:MAG: hypothetical protein LAP61_14000 [Acidobacteriia bacterium]|nr:hypothetical protein [Terriglobia bacterium]